jgi:hypothetical protein
VSEYKLKEEILKRSQAKEWDIAKLEWELNDIYEAEKPVTCLCGHFPIIQICTLQNKLNNQFATVGNCCVKKFIGLPSNLIFKAIKRVRKDNQKPLNTEAIQYAYEKSWINEFEHKFSIDTMRKRNLSPKQLQIRMQVNEKMLANMSRSLLG